MRIDFRPATDNFFPLMKSWAAFLSLAALLLLGACEKHPLADLNKVDPSALASPTPGH